MGFGGPLGGQEQIFYRAAVVTPGRALKGGLSGKLWRHRWTEGRIHTQTIVVEPELAAGLLARMQDLHA